VLTVMIEVREGTIFTAPILTKTDLGHGPFGRLHAGA
jgi:hypothetical protein